MQLKRLFESLECAMEHSTKMHAAQPEILADLGLILLSETIPNNYLTISIGLQLTDYTPDDLSFFLLQELLVLISRRRDFHFGRGYRRYARRFAEMSNHQILSHGTYEGREAVRFPNLAFPDLLYDSCHSLLKKVIRDVVADALLAKDERYAALIAVEKFFLRFCVTSPDSADEIDSAASIVHDNRIHVVLSPALLQRRDGSAALPTLSARIPLLPFSLKNKC
jgi:hypothetical protein